ncbi:hypothetical protein [Ideonella paludis]|uniref:Uncharacterized protein n=1 Tax=Ideonella paludis TaxID=1233411 RepID=A0ABS5E1H5_9BURK|nr:hypothetical protein [Ideonella paludis]MBQ0936891.1 hypothetical protein [Ideonella paludis]
MSQPHTASGTAAAAAPTPFQAHICVVHPWGDTQALETLDAALALRAELQAAGLSVTLARQQLRPDAVNFVFGVQYGFDAAAAAGQACVLVNTVPLKPGSLEMPPAALRLLKRWPVLETQPGSEACYRSGQPGEPAVAHWLPGPLQAVPNTTTPLAQRPLGLLMPGEATARQGALLAGMAQMGIGVERWSHSLAGPERQALCGQARAMLMLLREDDAPVDALGMALALRHGTPVLAERPNNAQISLPPALMAGVQWFEPTPQSLTQALAGGAMSEGFVAQAEQALAQWQAGPHAGIAAALALAEATWAASSSARQAAPVLDRLRLLGANEARWPGWWHVRAPQGLQAPDCDEVLDLGAALPTTWEARLGSLSVVDLGVWRPGRPDHAAALGAAARLLAEEGLVVLRWQVPQASGRTPEEALQEALAPWTDSFWGSGSFEHRLQVRHVGWQDAEGFPLASAQAAASARVVLAKQPTSLAERQKARAVRADFGLAAS